MQLINRALTVKQQEALNNWLTAKDIELNNRTRRNFSNVVNMAPLFKALDPKLVDLQNYTSHNSLAMKLQNWEVFNLKVLRRTGIHLLRADLELLASGDLNAIKTLLYHLMRLESKGFQLSSAQCSRAGSTRLNANEGEGEGDQQSIEAPAAAVNATSLPDQNLIEEFVAAVVNQSNLSVDSSVLAAEYEFLLNSYNTKTNYVKSLQQKVQCLERILETKDYRVKRLTDELFKLSERILAYEAQQKKECQDFTNHANVSSCNENFN